MTALYIIAAVLIIFGVLVEDMHLPTIGIVILIGAGGLELVQWANAVLGG